MQDEELHPSIMNDGPKGERFNLDKEPIVSISYNWEEIIHIREETGLDAKEIIEILNENYLPKLHN